MAIISVFCYAELWVWDMNDNHGIHVATVDLSPTASAAFCVTAAVGRPLG
jgi:hypothetical protein